MPVSPAAARLGDDLIRNQPAAAGAARVRQHRDPARRADQRDGPRRVERVPGHVRAPAGADPVRAERVLAGDSITPAAAMRPGDVRPADHAAAGHRR